MSDTQEPLKTRKRGGLENVRAVTAENFNPMQWETKSISADQVLREIDENVINIPEYQRQMRWNSKKIFDFIYSLLRGVPIDTINIGNFDGKRILIDGQHRLMSLYYYIKAKKDPKTGKVFKLQCEENPDLHDKSFDELSEEMQRFLLHEISIPLCISKAESARDLHLIFTKKNTNTTVLKPQEMRISSYDGKFIRLIQKLSDNKEFNELVGKMDKSKREELVIRFFAYSYNSENYQDYPNSKTFIDEFSAEHMYISDDEAEEFEEEFNEVCSLLFKYVGKEPLSQRTDKVKTNTYVLDALSSRVFEFKDKIDNPEFVFNYVCEKMREDEEFYWSAKVGGVKKNEVAKRLNILDKLFIEAIDLQDDKEEENPIIDLSEEGEESKKPVVGERMGTPNF